MKIIKDILTDNTGVDFDIVSIMGLISFLVFFALEIYNVVWAKQSFDMTSFGIATASLITSVGAAYHFKSNTAQSLAAPPK